MQVQAISNNQTSFNGVINVSENLAPKMKSFINKKLKVLILAKSLMTYLSKILMITDFYLL